LGEEEIPTEGNLPLNRCLLPTKSENIGSVQIHDEEVVQARVEKPRKPVAKGMMEGHEGDEGIIK